MKAFSIALGSSGEIGARVGTKIDEAKEAAYEELRLAIAARDIMHAAIQRAALRDARAATWREQVAALDCDPRLIAFAAVLGGAAKLEGEKLVASGFVAAWARRAGIDHATVLRKLTVLKTASLVEALQEGEGRRPWRYALVLDERGLAIAFQEAAERERDVIAEGERHAKQNAEVEM